MLGHSQILNSDTTILVMKKLNRTFEKSKVLFLSPLNYTCVLPTFVTKY